MMFFAASTSGCLHWQTIHDPDLASGRPVQTVGNDEIHFEDTGTGDPVLFVHGYGSTLETWGLVTPAICASRRCIRVDMKGFGRSSKYAGDYSPAAMADSLVGLLDHLGVPQADIVAHSYGGAVTLRLALDHPERVRRIVLTDAYVYDDGTPWFFAWSRPKGLGEVLYGLYYDQQLDYRIPLSFHDDSLVTHGMVSRARDVLSQPGSRKAALAVARGLDLDVAERQYHTIDKDVLLVWGAQDHVTPLRYGQRLQQHLPNASLHVVEYAGHFPMVEAAASYAETVDAFLSEATP